MRNYNALLGKIIVNNSAALIGKRYLISVLQVKPINIVDLQENEKIELTHQYRYFLRSLMYPLQIVLRLSNKESEKYLYRKRMADVEDIIKKVHKSNFKEILIESDAFKNWLKIFLETNVRPILLCYIVIPVITDIDLERNEIAYVDALQLLNKRTNDCISRLSEIKIKKKLSNNTKRCEWESEKLEKIQERKATIALGMFRRNETYYSISNLNAVNNGQRRVSDYIKNNFYDELLYEKELGLGIKRLNDNEVLNIFQSYCRDYILLNRGINFDYVSLKDIFALMNKSEMEMES